MNLKKLGRTFWVIAAVAMLAMVLQGCGGDDNGVDQSMHDQTVMDLQDMLDAANDKVKELEGQIGADADELATAKADAAKYKKMIDDEAAAKATKAASDKAEALRKLIDAVTLGDHIDINAAGTMPGDITLEVSAAGKLSAKADDYEMADAYPDMVEGFMGAMLMNEDDGDTIVVYTDRKAAESMALYDVYNNVRPSGMPRQFYVGRSPTSPEANDMPKPGDIMWSKVTADSGTTTVPADASATPPTMRMMTFSGMVGDVPGMFSCQGATGCSTTPPTRDSKGKITSTVGSDGTISDATNWRFTPTDANAMIDVANEDGHLVLGWWLSVNDDGPNDVDVFATAMNMDVARADGAGDGAGQVGSIEGTATYSGGAAGKYALHYVGTDRNSDAGHFTADAMLTADFDADTDTAGDEEGVMITGTIDGFMTGDMARDWTVKLSADGDGTDTEGVIALDDFADLTADVGTALSRTAEWDLGGNAKGVGTWEAQFWGSETDTRHPMAVTGEFNANLGTVGGLVGAFGAMNTSADDE